MPAPQTPYDAVLHAARDVAKLDCALDAEMLGTALLGSVYAVAATDRAAAVREFVGRVPRRHHPATHRGGDHDPPGLRIAGAGRGRRGRGHAAAPPAPPWTAQLGKVRPTGCYAYGDVYGDQTSYLVTFAYEDGEDGRPGARRGGAGRPQHRHHQGRLRGRPGRAHPRARSRRCAPTDELTWFREEDPGRLRGEVNRHLEVTDGLSDLPAEGSLATDRALAAARLALLPASTVPPLAEPPELNSRRTWSATSSPPRRPARSACDDSTPRTSWPRCTSA